MEYLPEEFENLSLCGDMENNIKSLHLWDSRCQIAKLMNSRNAHLYTIRGGR
jgi:hypothetical protein